MRTLPMLLSALLLPSLACAPPPAPKELDELCGYIFAHGSDENPRELQAGLANLDAWLLANLEETLEGYTVTNLSEATVAAIDDRNHNVDEMLGAAVGTISEGYEPYAMAIAMTIEDQTEVEPDSHVGYERTYLTDEQCFADLECEILETTNRLYDNYFMLGDVDSENYAAFRWVETEKGLAMVQISWLTRPSEVERESFELNDQYYLNIQLPKDGGTLALQSMWVDARLNDDSVSEELALSLVVSQLQKRYEYIEEFLDNNGAAVQPDGCSSSGWSGGSTALLGLLGLLGLAWRRRD